MRRVLWAVMATLMVCLLTPVSAAVAVPEDRLKPRLVDDD